ncbi:hypothetical protein FO519_002871 [Halicephalobus sp. NKZ332]|nr:hypothetical protein FO519_002871 [Halicephalobus sp. NKZ332]
MRNLLFRFVKHSTSLKPSDVAVHVVDPNVDFRRVFDNIEELQKNLNKRKIGKMQVSELARKYGRWWKVYEDFEGKSDQNEKRELKHALLEEEKGLIEILKLPNFLDSSHFLDEEVDRKKIYGFEKSSSMTRTTDSLENCIFNNFSPIRLDPPRMVRPAITEAFNYGSSEVIRFHEGQNPAMHLVGVSPPGLLVSFVSTKFSSTNSFPLVFLAKGTGYNRIYKGWQKEFVSMAVIGREKKEVDGKLAEIAWSLEELFHSSKLSKLEPDELKPYESSGAVIKMDGKVLTRISSAGTYLSERLKIVTNGEKYLYIGFVEIDVDCLYSRKDIK